MKTNLMPNINVEGFNPDELAQRYDDSNKAYLPLRVQLRWFFTVYPNGGYAISVPSMDPEHTPGCFQATAKVWTCPEDKEGSGTVNFTCRVKPDELAPVTAEESVMDPFEKCQYRALSTALRNMGFWVSMELDINGFPDEACDDTADSTETTDAVDEQPKKRRGRPRKNASPEPVASPLEVEEKNKEDEEATKTDVVEEAAEDDKVVSAAPVEEVVKAPEVNTEKAEDAPVEAAPVEVSEEDYEKACHVTINYRTWQDVELSTLVTGDKTEAQKKKDKSLLHWIASSTKAKEKFSNEQIAAAQVVYRKEFGDV